MTRTVSRCSGLVLLAIAAGLSACTTVLETASIKQLDGVACRSSVGGYYLPKALVRISIGPNTGRRGFLLNNDTPSMEMVTDRRQMYCLDYLASPTSVDVIAVERLPNGLLTSVSSNATDRTAKILINLIDTAENLAIAALREGTLDAAATGETADLQFDPFDPREMKMVNLALRRFGLCAYIEHHSFPESISPQRWCSDPYQERYVNPLNVEMATTPVMPEAMNTGILYRPNMAHKLVIRRKSDPSGREPWSLYVTKNLEMPNVSPVFSIGVYRAMFTNRTTNLSFDKGVLTNVSITKGSELEELSTVALRLAQAIVDLPTQIVQVRINDTNQASTLASSQGSLLTAVQQLAAARDTNRKDPLPAGVVDSRTMLQQCLDNKQLSIDICAKLVTGQ